MFDKAKEVLNRAVLAVDEKVGSGRDVISRGKKVLIFSEKKEFYKQLDKSIKDKYEVEILFETEKPEKDSQLWKRVGKCHNGHEFIEDLPKIKEPDAVFSPSMSACLTGPEIVLLVKFILTVVAATSIVIIAIYKTYRVELEIDPVTRKGKLILIPSEKGEASNLPVCQS